MKSKLKETSYKDVSYIRLVPEKKIERVLTSSSFYNIHLTDSIDVKIHLDSQFTGSYSLYVTALLHMSQE